MDAPPPPLPATPAAAIHEQVSGPSRRLAWRARLVAPANARSRPGGGKVRLRLAARARWNGGPQILLVLGTRTVEGRRYLRVALPRRPNGASGWVRADHAALAPTRWRVELSVRRRTVALLHRGRTVSRFRAVVGAPSTPTPTGLFAVSERVRERPGGFLGAWALHLTAHSNTLRDFGGGPGRVAIHGRGGASLADPLGTARSHGCVRVEDRRIRVLARRAPEGTPVLIRR